MVTGAATLEFRETFIAAGRDLLVENEGATLPSVVAVCVRAGHSRSVFYTHYLDRDEFLLELLDSVLADLTQAFVCDATHGRFDLAERIRHFATTVRSPASGEIAGLRTAYLAVLRSLDEHERVRKRHAESVARITDLLADAVRRGQEAGEFRGCLDPRPIAELLMLVSISGVLWSDAGVPMDSEEVGEGLVRLLGPPSVS